MLVHYRTSEGLITIMKARIRNQDKLCELPEAKIMRRIRDLQNSKRYTNKGRFCVQGQSFVWKLILNKIENIVQVELTPFEA